MDHSTTLMEKVGRATDTAAGPKPANSEAARISQADDGNRRTNNGHPRKRKADGGDSGMHHGGRGRGRGRNDHKRHQKGDMGRGEYFRDQPDKRAKTNESREKRMNGEGAAYCTSFSKEEIDAEERRPKRKVAVMIGYAGTGYKGMQITPSERTIEGDLFQAFIMAGAISKANADDPKKAGLVRCARTDKGVHAAGNMISLKLIVEDEDVVDKINSHLSPQIRVWGIERTIGSFSCYQACDSRWYEYLIPSHAFLPPHPSSWLAKKLEEAADEVNDREGYERRQEEVRRFWERVEEDEIQRILETIEDDLRWDVVKALQGEEEASTKAVKGDAGVEQSVKGGKTRESEDEDNTEKEALAEAAITIYDPGPAIVEVGKGDERGASQDVIDSAVSLPHGKPEVADLTASTLHAAHDARPPGPQLSPEEADRLIRLRAATKRLRNAYISSKRRYRILPQRISRVQSTLSKFVGTANYHNYTVQKPFKDPSARRHIKSFVVSPTPILIGEGPDKDKSEWLSLKVHGQSFMMHQIRKMIGMVALLVRCGSHPSTLTQSLSEKKFSIPKVPGLGLLLERPVFDSYNNGPAVKHQREPLRFDKFEREMEEFKQREIYQRIFREEEEKNEFGRFFNHVDNFTEPWFLYVTSKGVGATKGMQRSNGSALEPDDGEEGGSEEEDLGSLSC